MGGGAGQSSASSNNTEGMHIHTVNNAAVSDWASSHDGDAYSYALNPPDTITINGVNFDNISGGSTRSITGSRTADYTSNYQSSEQASNGEYPVVQVTVTETSRRVGGKDLKVYHINKGKTKLW